jgi:hypothetical protein
VREFKCEGESESESESECECECECECVHRRGAGGAEFRREPSND